MDIFRPHFATHYKFQRGTSEAIITANKDRATTLLKKAAFHYKVKMRNANIPGTKVLQDTETCKGYTENAIIPAAHTQIIFKDKKSLAAIFSSYFNPIPAPYLALEFSVLCVALIASSRVLIMSKLQFLTPEWSTGTHVDHGEGNGQVISHSPLRH
jgi:hypothetical protein